jgi:hypothetical protein
MKSPTEILLLPEEARQSAIERDSGAAQTASLHAGGEGNAQARDRVHLNGDCHAAKERRLAMTVKEKEMPS